ncbi:MAG: hypothetical protein JST85_05830 [Acidobacteria bacterium]|nr:hypothetical protein [Acidobacteriota bacterium]
MEVDTEPFEINGVFTAFWIIIFILGGVIFYFAERSFRRYAEQNFPELYADLVSIEQIVLRFRKAIFATALKLYRAIESSYQNSEVAKHVMQKVIPAILLVFLISSLLLFFSKWLLNLSYQ